MVNATQQFVKNALRGNASQKRIKKPQTIPAKQPEPVATEPKKLEADFVAPEGLKTSIKQAKDNQAVFKGINMMQTDDGRGLKFFESTKSRKVQFDV